MSKRTIHQYKEEQLTQAMTAIRNGKVIKEASRDFSVSRGTLQNRLHLRVPEIPHKMGPDSVLSKKEGTALKDIALAKFGFTLKCDHFLNTVHNIIFEENRTNLVFPYVRPSKDVINSMPAGWLLEKSETGWMKSDIFKKGHKIYNTH